jgi:hypothetical protein
MCVVLDGAVSVHARPRPVGLTCRTRFMRLWRPLLFFPMLLGGCSHAALLESPVAMAPPPETAPLPPPLPVPRVASPPIAQIQRPRPRVIRPSRDPRPRAKPRPWQTIAAEIRIYEARLRMLWSWDPTRLDVIRDIADDYVEQASSGGPFSVGAHRTAWSHYDTLVRATGYPFKDEVRYYLGLEYELDGLLARAGTTYREIVRSNSRFAPYAAFGLGELALEESNFDGALQWYSSVLHVAANPLEPDAVLRIGQVHEAKGELDLARPMFRQLLRLYPTSDAASEVPNWARP